MRKYAHHLRLFVLFVAVLGASLARAQATSEAPIGEATEHQLSTDDPLKLWATDPNALDTLRGDRLEQRAVTGQEAKTLKLKSVVPPIRFESGVADIPPSTIEKLRNVLEGMRDLENVRLHLVGHADSQPLSGRLMGIYGDNEGLSRERAGEVAEFIQKALELPPEAISFEWVGDSQPVASNDTAAGRALNRRVEVEVWYDRSEAKSELQDIVVPGEIKQVKVCRMEKVCKLRYREGEAHRARVKNLVAPLHFDEETVRVSDSFVQQIGQALQNLQGKQNVTVKFIGFTDDAALSGRAERIYGTPLALSKAMAYRVALATQDTLRLPSAAIASDGRGTAQPLASNETARGRALNRRIEVEFWYDDPLQQLPDEPQLCPNAAGAEVVTKVYEPPSGAFAPLAVEDGQIDVPAGYTEQLRHAMDEIHDKANVRLRFVGRTRSERLDRRTALVYGDDVGLSTSRAHRAMEKVQAELGLSDAQVEHEGRGYVHSDDVVNSGFVEGETSDVQVQVVYDELAVLEDYDGVDVTPLTRELSPKNPLGLNPMRITVDGDPIDDPNRSSEDVQRCTDVAFDRADLRFGFDNLRSSRRLSVTASPESIPIPASASDGAATPPPVRFKAYENYAAFIARSEVRIFERDQSLQSTPLAVLEVGRDGSAEWQPTPAQAGQARELKYVLRAYDASGHFDETSPRPLWMVYEDSKPPGQSGEATPQDDEQKQDAQKETAQKQKELLAGYGENVIAIQNIPLGSGTVKVQGGGVPPGHTVWLAGEPVPVDENGNFVAETILPSGTHTVEVAMLDEEGNGQLFLRDLELKGNDWFYMGTADMTLTTKSSSKAVEALTGANAPYDPASSAYGRLAFFVDGKFWEDWKLRASADTREGPVRDLFSNLMDKSPDSLFRRIDPDYYYPTYGDDGTVEELAPTSGKFFAEVSHHDDHALWGNFKVGYLDNELAPVDRALYGGDLHYESDSTTSFGEKRAELDGFGAEPGTVPSREEFRGTGGSLYYLRQQDILAGSDRVRIEMRDRDSGLVTSVVQLQPSVDYDIDYFQGRILLSEPLTSTGAGNSLLVRNGLNGDEAWLVVQYEYTPGFDKLSTIAAGGEGHYWFGDFLKLGFTASNDVEGEGNSNLYGADVTLRKSSESWLRLQGGRREGMLSDWALSNDGGFGFQPTDGGLNSATANAYRADLSLGLGDFFAGAGGRVNLYAQDLGAGYSTASLIALTDTMQYGGGLRIPLTDRLFLAAKGDKRVATDGLDTQAAEADLGYQLTSHWSVGAGVRNELRQDNSPVVPVTQEQGSRTDATVQVGYDPKTVWRTYGFVQDTLAASGSMPDNARVGVGGAYRINDRFTVDGEGSYGQLGPGAKIGTSYQATDRTNLYMSYGLDNELGDDGQYGQRSSVTAGARSRLSDSASMYVEERYQTVDSKSGLTHATGVNLTPTDRWNLGTTLDFGTLVDRNTGAETRRKAGGVRVGYGFEKIHFSSGIEYRNDQTQQLTGGWADRVSWVFRNNLKYQLTPDWRLVGKLDWSLSNSTLGQLYDGGYTEGVLGWAYRPVANDRLNVLAKYTYFYNIPATDQFNVSDVNSNDRFLQKNHIASLDVTYDLTSSFTLGGKYAYRMGQVSLDRLNPDFVQNDAHLGILRLDWRFVSGFEASAEARILDLPDLNDRRAGALLVIYRYLGDHTKIGVGYNFTDFSDDLTDLSYNHHGFFINLNMSM